MELKKIRETADDLLYGYTDEMGLKDKNTGKYIKDENDEYILVEPKFSIIKLNKGSLMGIDPKQELSTMVIRPIKFIFPTTEIVTELKIAATIKDKILINLTGFPKLINISSFK